VVAQVDHGKQVGRAFYDLTYSAPKTVSVYYAALLAAGQHELAAAVLASHDEAAEYASAYLEEQTWVRSGRHTRSGEATTGVFERPVGLIRIAFQHSTSRATDPHLHSHVGVVNRAPCADGKWRALHAGAWNQVKGAAAARYEQKMAALIEERTPARFAVREDGMAREIAGIDPAALDESSQRTRQVLAAREDSLDQFREKFGREPTPQEQRRIHRTAGLESRSAKSHTGPDELLAAWASRDGIDPAALVAGVHKTGADLAFWGRPDDVVAERRAVREALAEVQAEAAAWNVGVLAARIAMKLPARLVERAEELAAESTAAGNTVGVVDLTRRELVGVPGEFVDRSRSAPVWRDPGLGLFALADHLRAEVQLAASARAHTVQPWTETDVAALRAEWEAAGDTITADQADAVAAVLLSPRAGDVLVAAAGTGKSYIAGKLAEAWTARGGAVLGTATSQIASHVLTEHGLPAINATQFLQRYEPDAPAAGGQRLQAGSLLVFDEANMTSTDQLRRVQQVAQRDGCKVLYFGDPRQLAAVGAGGALELMARENGAVAELEEPLRFVEQWERDASVRLRAGDVSVIAEYTARGRVHGGIREDMVTTAVDRYVADVAAGRSSALITATNGEAAEVSALVQQRLAQLGLLGDGEVLGDTLDGNVITAGDRIQWRENVYTVDADDRGPLINREFLRVVGRDDRGRVHLERESNGTAVYVPAEWLNTRAALGYGGTEHAYEGVTVDTGHALVPGYVAMTRGRLRNEAWLATIEPGDEHGEAVDVSPADLFADAMSASGRVKSAMETWRAELDAGKSTANLSAIWEQVTTVAVRDAAMDSVGAALGWDAVDRISTEDGRERLMTAMARAELAGHDRDAVLREAIDSRPLDRVDDLAGVLAWRMERALDKRDPERVASTWTERAEGLAGRGDDVGRFAAEVGAHLDRRGAELGERVAADRPMWAREQLGEVPVEVEQREEWQRRAGMIAAYREQCGIADALPSVGARPHESDVSLLLAWRDAARAGGRPVDELSYQALPDSDLEATRARWRRQAEAAPHFVEPELGRAYDAQRQAEADAVLLRQAATQESREDERAELERRAGQRDHDAAVAAARAAVLQATHDTRQVWLAEHERDRDAALESERELKRRGRVPDAPEQEPEQTCLFEITTDHEPIVEEAREVEPEQTAEVEVERETGQGALLEVEPDPAAVARQQQLAVDDEDQAVDNAARESLLAREMVGNVADLTASLADIEVRARYAREQLARRQEQRHAEIESAERERIARDAREVEREQVQDREADQELSYPDEPELDYLGM
jgi:conjugative relaxase-like TrwC/TraI family protein